MRVSEIIKQKLRTDKDFRRNTATALNVGERNIYKLLESNSDNLTKMAAVKIYFEAGFTEDQIFEPVEFKSISNN